MALKGSRTSVNRSSDTARASRTVKPAKSRESWKERPRPSRARADAVRSVMSTPASSTLPASGRRKPEITSNSVVLPAPFGPMMPDDLPVACVQGDVVECGVATEREGDAAYLELAAHRRRWETAAQRRPERVRRLLEVDGPQQLGVCGQLVGGPGEAHGTGLHDVHTIRHRHRDVHGLLDQEDGRPGLAHRFDGTQQLLDDDRREAEGELVNEEELGPGDGRHGQGQHLLLSSGEVGGPFLASRGERRERGERLVDHVGVVLAAAPALPGRHPQVVLDAQVGKDPLAAGHLRHAQPGDLVGREVGDVAAVEDDGPVIGLDDPADGSQQCRFAGAVGTDQGDDLALADLDGHVGQDDHAVVADAELPHGQQRQPALVAINQHLGPGTHRRPHVPRRPARSGSRRSPR